MEGITNIQHFQLFCLENYKSTSNKSGAEALNEFKRTHAFEYLASGYDVLHTQGKEYLMDDLKEYITRRMKT